MTFLRMWTALFAVVLFAAPACSATATIDDREPASAIELPESDPAPGVTVEAGPDELPPAFSRIRSVGDVGLYYADMDGQMRLIAFDAATGQSRYQIDASPLLRIRGVGQDLIVDEDLGLVFMTGSISGSGSADASYIAAHDATTGAELWRTGIDPFSAQPNDCGELICVRNLDNRVGIDKLSGDIVERSEVADRRVLLSTDDLWISTILDEQSGFQGLGGSGPGGTDERWRVQADAIEAAVGTQVDPGGGWAALFDDEHAASVVFLAAADGSGWSTIGVDAEGTITWGRDDLSLCVESPFDYPPIVCRIDGFQTVELMLLNAETGAPVWAIPLDEATGEIIYDGRELVLWSFFETANRLERVDLATGARSASNAPAVCLVPTGWSEFQWLDAGPASFAGSDQYSACASDGTYLAPRDLGAAAVQLDLGGQTLWLVDEFGVPVVQAN